MTDHGVHELMQVRAFRFRTFHAGPFAAWIGGTAQRRGVVLALNFVEVRLLGRVVGFSW